MNYTSHHISIPLNNPRRNIPSECDQNARYRLQQSAIDSFHAEIHGPVFWSVVPEAKLDMYNNFDLDELFDLYLDPPSSEDPPLCRIIQEDKEPILTTDFYLTNVEPKPWILPTPPSNKDTPKLSDTAAADKFTPIIESDPVQPGKIRLHSWMLYTPQTPVLDLREEMITSTLDLGDTFHQLHLCPEEDETHLEQYCSHFHIRHKYRDTFGDAHVQYHDFDNGEAFTYKDKYTILIQQELQNPYWCSHDPATTTSYPISTEMDIETMPHAMYFSGNIETVTKINHVPYQTVQYDDKGAFPAKLMDDTCIQVFIDNGATPSILLISTYNKYPVLQRYPKTKSTTPIHTQMWYN